MKAIILKEAGPADNLQFTELAVPTIGAGEVLVKVNAISINPVDVKTRAGKGKWNQLREEGPVILGWDISGTVTATESPLFKVGDEVFGMVNFPGHGKAYAEYVAAPAAHLALKPTNISHEEAAAATLAALTAWQGMTGFTPILPGQKVLVHAAAGGVGHYAVQLAKYWGAYVIGTSSATNKAVVMDLGADEHIDYTTRQLDDHAKDIDFVLDTLGGDNIDRSLAIMKKNGTIVSLPSGLKEAVAEKAHAQGINGHPMMVASSGADMQKLANLLEQGKLRSIVSKTFAFNEMVKAHEQVETGRTVGKVIVQV
ncbi:NADP-dependent oxidoreductase [Chitinophaga sp. 22321]|uniref:NADP-dependent oxidoreductase n=1 Tax=Chitinophaga hostae TaxID=2831022 RepID=A0ABS5JAA9_9BACT|nr:NADP-dependent oxidoreductase [Chitinophaga hostae]MBS0032145.1 NADP-dependent oxidoreductase [Chitinophaga hostae]